MLIPNVKFSRSTFIALMSLVFLLGLFLEVNSQFIEQYPLLLDSSFVNFYLFVRGAAFVLFFFAAFPFSTIVARLVGRSQEIKAARKKGKQILEQALVLYLPIGLFIVWHFANNFLLIGKTWLYGAIGLPTWLMTIIYSAYLAGLILVSYIIILPLGTIVLDWAKPANDKQ